MTFIAALIALMFPTGISELSVLVRSLLPRQLTSLAELIPTSVVPAMVKEFALPDGIVTLLPMIATATNALQENSRMHLTML
jgi:hypothetical protein